MKKSLVLVAVLSVALSGLGFAAAGPACAGMEKAPGCCKDVCPCSIQERSQDQAMPSGLSVYGPEQPVMAESYVLEMLPPDPLSRGVLIEPSPPEPTPLYQLFSVYRI